MPTIITAILLDQEARANDQGGNDLATDGHLQEPALLLPGYIRAFSGTMTTANWYASNMASMGEDIYSPPSVFNYFSPGYTVAGTGGLKGPEFQIFNPNGQLLLFVGSFGQEPGFFRVPSAIFIDKKDRIYVSDGRNSRIQMLQFLGGN